MDLESFQLYIIVEFFSKCWNNPFTYLLDFIIGFVFKNHFCFMQRLPFTFDTSPKLNIDRPKKMTIFKKYKYESKSDYEIHRNFHFFYWLWWSNDFKNCELKNRNRSHTCKNNPIWCSRQSFGWFLHKWGGLNFQSTILWINILVW